MTWFQAYTFVTLSLVAALTVYNHYRLQRLLNERDDEVRRHHGFRPVPKHLADADVAKAQRAEQATTRQVSGGAAKKTRVRTATMRARRRITTR